MPELKQKVQHLQNLLQIEHSIHQAPPEQEPKSISDELNKLELLTQMYNETIQETLATEDQLQDDYYLGSGIKWMLTGAH